MEASTSPEVNPSVPATNPSDPRKSDKKDSDRRPRPTYFTVPVSSLALVLSVISFVQSTWQGHYEEQRTIRSQLTDVLAKYMSTTIDILKASHEFAQSDPKLYQALSGGLNQQQEFLLHQAMYLATQIPRQVSSVEYETIAFANVGSGDLINADKYYRKAIEVSPDDNYRSQATRQYAVFLFTQHRFEEGRGQFQQAASLIKGTDNWARAARGQVYQFWAVDESVFADSPTRASQLFESARNEYAGIDISFTRDYALQNLEATRQAPAAISSATTSGISPLP
jgi:tetratricopeptide (TPR) repeat protein